MIKLIDLLENRQLADKLYFNTGKIDNEGKILILNITNGDATTKFVCDAYLQMKEIFRNGPVIKDLIQVHKELVNYNKNVFPIKDFDINNSKNLDYDILLIRQEIIRKMRGLPSTAIRNLKTEIRTERDYSEMRHYNSDLEYFLAKMSLLSNRDEEVQKRIYKKIFTSKMNTLTKMIDFTEEKENLLGGVDITREYVMNLVNQGADIEPVYENGSVLVLNVYSEQGIKAIGSNSLWCFTYGDDTYRTWSQFSHNGQVYVIIDFSKKTDDSEFMYVLIRPLKGKYTEEEIEDAKSPLFDMSNMNYFDPIRILSQLVGRGNIKKIFTFEY